MAALILATLLPFGALAAGAHAARSNLDPLIGSLFRTRTFRQVAISPDGVRVGWVERLHQPDGTPSNHSAIYIEHLGSSQPEPCRVSASDGEAEAAEYDLAWSPDSRQLAFLSDAMHADDAAQAGGSLPPGQAELYVADVAGCDSREHHTASARRLTRLRGDLSEPRWSPDGRSLALLFIADAPRAAGPLEPMTPPSGEISEQIFEQRIAVAALASGETRQVSPPGLYVYEYDWSPDGKTFAATAAPGSGDSNWWIAQLYTIDAGTGEARAIYQPRRSQIAEPHWSPDGRQIAFIEGLMSDQGSNGGDVFVVAASGGEARDVTPGMKASASWLTWTSPSQILFAEDVDGESGVATVNPGASAITTLWTGAEAVSAGSWGTNLSLARDGRTSAVIRDSFSAAPEVWAGPIGRWQEITHLNRDLRPAWGEAKSLHWTSDGFRVQGWLLFPQPYDPSKRYPLVVSVHGGPGSAERPSWPGAFYNTSLLSSEGYFVLYPNPRGSFGQGEDFTRANVKDFGYGDFRDILAGVDEVIKTLRVDSNRVGITGWSYGGFMTMWAVTQTNRFRAAVAGAGIANWQSYYGENDIDQWMIPFFGASVYDNPEVYRRSSPITFIKQAKTPTLVVVGDRDGECPAPQSFEFWHALKTLGAPSSLVVYPGEGHRIWQPAHVRDIIKRQVEWFDRYLGPGNGE